MGCDIHVRAEVRTGDEWVPVTEPLEPFEGRNYYMFSLFAGVRFRFGYPAAIRAPRGLPRDVSEPVSAALSDRDYHSESWLTVGELLAVDYTLEDKQTLGPCYFDDLATLKQLGEPDDVRIVFAFDN